MNIPGLLAPYATAIQKIESSGNYGATGPVTKSGDRAYGAYQVMGANIPTWSQQALGKTLTPQQFLSDKDAQDAIFAHQFSNNMQKYGSPQDAASVWFTGHPQAQGGSSSDILGTTGNQYVDKFNAALPTGPLADSQNSIVAPAVPAPAAATPDAASAAAAPKNDGLLGAGGLADRALQSKGLMSALDGLMGGGSGGQKQQAPAPAAPQMPNMINPAEDAQRMAQAGQLMQALKARRVPGLMV